MDINDPRNPNNVNRPSEFPDSPAAREGMMWPIGIVIAALVAGLLFFGTTRTDQPTTQVGQNVERPATPNTTQSTPKTAPQ